MPASSLAIEQRFEDLQELLGSGPSPRLALVALTEFLELFGTGMARSESYLREILPQLGPLDPLDALGLPLAVLDRSADVFERVRTSVSPACRALLRSLPDSVDQLIYLTRIIVGAREEGSHAGLTSKRSSLEDLPLSVRLQRLSEACPEDALLAQLARSLRFPHDGTAASVLVVERANWSGRLLGVGGVRRMRLLGTALADSADQLSVDFPLAPGAASSDVVDAPLAAAHRMANADQPRLARFGLVGKLSLHPSGHRHTGRSAELALALVAYSALRRAGQGRTSLGVNPTAAFTGTVLEDGRVMPVDKETLEEKVTGAFFSPVDVLVFPEIQRHIVMGVVDALHARYPGRQLPIIGVRSVRDAMYDKRVVQTRRMSLPAYALRGLWRGRVHLFYSFITLLLVGVLWQVTRPPVDLSPVRGQRSGTVFQLLNAKGAVLDEIDFGDFIWGKTIPDGSDAPERYYALSDLDGDGVNEICWLRQENGSGASVSCKASGASSPLWSIPLVTRWDFADHFEEEDRPLSPTAIAAGVFEASGDPLVFVVVRDVVFFASAVLKIDARSGRILSRYVHPGWLNRLDAMDIDGDGVQELAVGGAHQAYNDPVVAILDPRFVSGDAPSPPRYAQNGAAPAPARWYIRFPDTPLSYLLRYVDFNRSVSTMNWGPGGLEIGFSDGVRVAALRASVSQALESRGGSQLLGDTETILLPYDGAYFVGRLGLRLEPVWFGSATSYDRIARFLYERGFLDEVPDRAYWNSYRDSVLYWDGDAWVAGKPVVNRHYLEALDAWKTVRLGDRRKP